MREAIREMYLVCHRSIPLEIGDLAFDQRDQGLVKPSAETTCMYLSVTTGESCGYEATVHYHFPKTPLYSVKDTEQRRWSCTLPKHNVNMASLPRILSSPIGTPERATYHDFELGGYQRVKCIVPGWSFCLSLLFRYRLVWSFPSICWFEPSPAGFGVSRDRLAGFQKVSWSSDAW